MQLDSQSSLAREIGRFGYGLPALNADTCLTDMIQAEQIYARQGTRSKNVYFILASCNKLAGLVEEAETACNKAKEIEPDTAEDKWIDGKLIELCK